MTIRSTALSGLTLLALAMGAVGSASAQSTWDLSTSTCDPMGSGIGNTAGCTMGGVTATVTGWATSTTSSASLLEQATLTDQGSSGIGITSQGETAGSPNHAIDSSGKDELVLINFGTDKVNLTGLATGWSYNDTDISVLRWDGGLSGPDLTTMSLTSTSPATALTLSGWTLVGSGDIDGSDSNGNATFGQRSAGISNAGSSSWWIITAYYGSNSGNLTKNDDYFKLLSFSGKCTSNVYGGACGTTDNPGGGGEVAEPGSVALAGLALAGLFGVRRRRRQNVI